MAKFDKFANLSLRGWDKKSLTQSIALGQNAHIGLWGGGPRGEDLEVVSSDETICVTHEEPRPHQAHWRHFLLSGLTKGTVNINAFLPGTSNAWATMKVLVVGKSGIKLVFFPGERNDGTTVLGRIYVIGGHGEWIAAAAGPRVAYKSPSDYGHTAEPTPAGHYTLGPRKHVVTPTWWLSAIPWGAALRLNGAGEVEFEDDSGRGGWHLVTGPKGVLTASFLRFKLHSGEKMTLPKAVSEVRNFLIDSSTRPVKLKLKVWELNDFGRWGWTLLLHGKSTPYIIHTTPRNEKDAKHGDIATLANSHGCIHIDPKDRDAFMANHYLDAGVDFEVRPYSENGPP